MPRYTKDDVQKLISDLGKRASEMKFEVGEPYLFGLALDVFDPISLLVLSVARPHRRDLGQEEVLLTADQVATEIASARSYRAQLDRTSGVLTEAQVKAAEEAKAAAETKKRDDEAAVEQKKRDDQAKSPSPYPYARGEPQPSPPR